MNKFFKNMMMALAGLSVAAMICATPMTANATRVLGSQSGGTSATQQTEVTTEAPAELIGNGTVTADSVRVRRDATTSSDVVGKATQGTAVGVTAEKNDGDGMLWYAVTFQSEGKTVNGYIRSDLMSYEANAAAPEESVPEEAPVEEAPVEEPAPVDDYYVQYTDDGTGTSDWYLFDQTMGKHYRISELLSAQQTGAADLEEVEDQAGTFRIIIVILAVVILILIGVVTFLIIKLRSAGDDYEYDDDDDEEEEEEDEEDEEEEPVRRRGFFGRRRVEEDDDEDEEDEEDEEEEEERPVRRAPGRRPANVRPSRRYEEEEEEDEEDEEEEYKPRRNQKASRNQKDKNWQSKNFLDDDDLEFEFLDLK